MSELNFIPEKTLIKFPIQQHFECRARVAGKSNKNDEQRRWGNRIIKRVTQIHRVTSCCRNLENFSQSLMGKERNAISRNLSHVTGPEFPGFRVRRKLKCNCGGVLMFVKQLKAIIRHSHTRPDRIPLIRPVLHLVFDMSLKFHQHCLIIEALPAAI